MKKRHLIISLIITILAAMLAPTIAAAVLSPDFLEDPSQVTDLDVSCSQPTTVATEICRQLEEHILSATVRFRIDSWIVKEDESGYEINYSFGHATLKDDRYLVTHNHFGIPLSIRPQNGEPETYEVITLFNSMGERLYKGSLSEFELVWEDPEALVIGSKDDGLFKNLGFQSAAFQDWTSASLEPGMEVAQVDWDGVTTRIDWTTIQEVYVEDGVPRLALADDVMLGASGGGIFWKGVHVANNWQLVQQFEESGTLINANTIAALNGQAFQNQSAAKSTAVPEK